MNLDQYPNVNYIKNQLEINFSFLSAVIERQYNSFGESWLKFFEEDLGFYLDSDPERLKNAVAGYGEFALESMKLQIKFQVNKEYENKSFEEASSEVYLNEDYMFNLYLPGLYLSHFLWAHHYKQHIFFMDKFLPLVKQHSGGLFYDVGVGTGFYSKEMLKNISTINGEGFDLSPYSLRHTKAMLSSRKLGDRYKINLSNIVTNPPKKKVPFILSIEVLEHLENPEEFLCALNNMLGDGGLGLISAAINAANADHIYLYKNTNEVKEQIEKCGFKIIDYIQDEAYPPKKDEELVPVNASFIVTK